MGWVSLKLSMDFWSLVVGWFFGIALFGEKIFICFFHGIPSYNPFLDAMGMASLKPSVGRFGSLILGWWCVVPTVGEKYFFCLFVSVPSYTLLDTCEQASLKP